MMEPHNSRNSALRHVSGDFVTMRAGSLWLVVPQSHVVSADRLDDLPETEMTAIASGVFSSPTEFGDTRYYIALSEYMQRMENLPYTRYLVTRFLHNQVYWCWDEVNVMINATLHCHAISEVIKTDKTPVDTLVTWGDDTVKHHGFLCASDDIIDSSLDEALRARLAEGSHE